jgi:hypothetical protein
VFLSLQSPDPRNSEMGSDQRSRSHLDLTAAIKSRFRISRFRDSCGYYSLTSPTLDPRNSEMDWDQRSRSNLDLTAQIKSRFRISRFRDSCGYYSLTSPTLDPRNSEMDWDQRSRSNLDLTAQIKLSHDFTYRDFERLGNPVPLTLQSAN